MKSLNERLEDAKKAVAEIPVSLTAMFNAFADALKEPEPEAYILLETRSCRGTENNIIAKPPEQPVVKNPEGKVWRTHRGLGIHLKLGSCDMVGATCRPITPSEAFRVGALVRWKRKVDSRDQDESAEGYVTKVDGDCVKLSHTGGERFLMSYCTLVKPAPEEKS